MSARPVATPPNAWATLRARSPVVTVMVAVLALFASLAILVGAALGRMEGRLRADVAEVRADVAELSGDVRELRGELQGLSDRVARIEGALTAPRAAPARADGTTDPGG